MALFYVMRPSSTVERFPTFTRIGGLSRNLKGCTARAEKCLGRVYSTDSNSKTCVGDFWVEPEPEAPISKREYWSQRIQVAAFGVPA